MEHREHLSEKLLARRWGVSHRTLERWRHDARGPAFLKVGGRVIYRIQDIQAYEAKQLRTSTLRSEAGAR
jgi:predicted site-specific integrase-resolvase